MPSLDILRPNYELTEKIDETRSDRRVSIGFSIAGVAFFGAGVAGVYSMISGEYVPLVGAFLPGSGALSTGVVLGGPGISGTYQRTSELRQLRRRQRQEMTLALDHYRQNQEFYQLAALQEATEAGQTINGWTAEA